MTQFDKNQLVELYKATLEEIRHLDTIFMQMNMALGVVISLFLAAIGFLFSKDFPLNDGMLAKISIWVLFFFVALYFYQAFRRVSKYITSCSEIAKNIETELDEMGTKNKSEESAKVKELLFFRKLRETEGQMKFNFAGYPIIAVVSLIALFVLPFFFIE